MLKALVIDCYGTLISPSNSYVEVTKEARPRPAAVLRKPEPHTGGATYTVLLNDVGVLIIFFFQYLVLLSIFRLNQESIYQLIHFYQIVLL
jgi:hypothetical protein